MRINIRLSLKINLIINVKIILSAFQFIVTILQCIWFSNFIRQSSVQLKLYGKIVAISIFNYEIKTTSFPSKCFLIATTADCNLWITVYTFRYMIYIKTSDHVSFQNENVLFTFCNLHINVWLQFCIGVLCFLSTFVCFGYLNLIRPYLGNLHMTDVEKYHLIRSTLAARISQKSIQYSLSYLLYSCCCSCCCKIHLHVLMPIYFARKGNYFKSRRFISKPQAIILLVNLLEWKSS